MKSPYKHVLDAVAEAVELHRDHKCLAVEIAHYMSTRSFGAMNKAVPVARQQIYPWLCTNKEKRKEPVGGTFLDFAEACEHVVELHKTHPFPLRKRRK